MLNTIVLIGNLGGDPEMFYSSEGNPIASFSIAFQGSRKDKTGWMKVTAFGKLAEISEKYLKRGSRVAVSGQLCVDNWQTDQGQNRTTYKIIVKNLELIRTDRRGQDDEEVPF